MKISVITVCKNAETVIERTLQSVVSQTYQSLEYIIIDGNSTDRTVEIIQKYEKHISLLISEPDSGIYQAMNKGVKLASGDIICLLNASDTFGSEYSLEVISRFAAKYQADIYYANMLITNNDSHRIVSTNFDFIEDKIHLLHSDGFGHSATFYTKTAFQKAGFFSEENKIVSDYEWNLKALIYNKLKYKYIKDIVAVFYTGGVSETHDELRLQEKQMAINKYFSATEQFFFKNKLFINLLKNRIFRKVICKLFGWKLNRLFLRIGDF